jgi:hypothetical protein
MDNKAKAAQILLGKHAQNAIKDFWANEEGEAPHLTRHTHVKQLRFYKERLDRQTFPRLFTELTAALQAAYAVDQRHWSDWDQPWREPDPEPVEGMDNLIRMAQEKLEAAERQILSATGLTRVKLVHEMRNMRGAIADMGYITLMPEEYIEYPDGERLGYNEMRYLLSILEDEEVEAPYETDEENRVFREANQPVGFEYEEVFEEDRGYEPPTFTLPLELDFEDVRKFLLDKDTQIQIVVQVALETGIPALGSLLTNSYLGQAERVFALRDIASQICEAARKAGKKITFEETFDELTYQANLDEFIELHEEELFDRDPGDHGGETTEADVLQIEAHLMKELLEAPAISLPIPDVQRLWNENKRQFPAQEKVVSWRANGRVHFRTKDQADYQTLQKLYTLAGLQIDGRLIHSHTPFYQRGVIERIANGASIKDAYALTRTDYLAYRHDSKLDASVQRG